MDITSHLSKADEAARRKNFKHAVRLYWQVLAFKPDHGEARRGLRSALARQAEYRPVSRWVARLVGFPHIASMAFSRMAKRPDRLAQACERYLAVDPANEVVTLRLGEALSRAGHLNAALAVYEFLGSSGKGHAGALREAGSLHFRLGNVQQALECLERCLALDPHDAEADKLRKNVAAESALVSGGYSTAASSRELMRDRARVERQQRAERVHLTENEIADEIADLEKRLQADRDPRVRRKLIELYGRRDEYEKALAAVADGLAREPDSLDLLDTKGDIQIAIFRREIGKLRERLEKTENAELRRDLEDLEAEALAFETGEFKRRVASRPTDLELWYQLGLRYLSGPVSTASVDQAVEAFQHSVRDPRRRTDSLTRLARCFFLKGLYDLAEKQLLQALEALPAGSDRGKEVLYNLGLIAEKASRQKEAVTYYGRIYEVDIGYRDVARKIEELTRAEKGAGTTGA
ncbi:MAG: tetratricopeptide repeat protein [Planctomycetota bacterium]